MKKGFTVLEMILVLSVISLVFLITLPNIQQKNEIIQSFSEEESNLYKQYLDKKQQLDLTTERLTNLIERKLEFSKNKYIHK